MNSVESFIAALIINKIIVERFHGVQFFNCYEIFCKNENIKQEKVNEFKNILIGIKQQDGTYKGGLGFTYQKSHTFCYCINKTTYEKLPEKHDWELAPISISEELLTNLKIHRDKHQKNFIIFQETV
jgi:hypothetical protein